MLEKLRETFRKLKSDFSEKERIASKVHNLLYILEWKKLKQKLQSHCFNYFNNRNFINLKTIRMQDTEIKKWYDDGIHRIP